MHRILDVQVVLEQVKLRVPRVQDTASECQIETQLHPSGDWQLSHGPDCRGKAASAASDPKLGHLVSTSVEVVRDHFSWYQQHLQRVDAKNSRARRYVLRVRDELRRWWRRRRSFRGDLSHLADFSVFFGGDVLDDRRIIRRDRKTMIMRSLRNNRCFSRCCFRHRKRAFGEESGRRRQGEHDDSYYMYRRTRGLSSVVVCVGEFCVSLNTVTLLIIVWHY